VSAKRQETAQKYFQVKRRQLLAMSEQGVAKFFLAVLVQRSRETDVVIWEAANYPSLPLANHATAPASLTFVPW
jgi:hypothetical protein